MRFIPLLLAAFLCTITVATAADTKHPKTLAQYETVRAGLAADDLAAARNGATGLVTAVREEFADSKPMIDAAEKLAASKSIEDARSAFGVISGEVIKVVQGQPGLFVMNCPMVKNGTWVQTISKIENPYMGKKMLECGEIVKQ